MWSDLMAVSFFDCRCDEAICFDTTGISCDHGGH